MTPSLGRNQQAIQIDRGGENLGKPRPTSVGQLDLAQEGHDTDGRTQPRGEHLGVGVCGEVRLPYLRKFTM